MIVREHARVHVQGNVRMFARVSAAVLVRAGVQAAVHLPATICARQVVKTRAETTVQADVAVIVPGIAPAAQVVRVLVREDAIVVPVLATKVVPEVAEPHADIHVQAHATWDVVAIVQGITILKLICEWLLVMNDIACILHIVSCSYIYFGKIY
jgi:hypothetical protein